MKTLFFGINLVLILHSISFKFIYYKKKLYVFVLAASLLYPDLGFSKIW